MSNDYLEDRRDIYSKLERSTTENEKMTLKIAELTSCQTDLSNEVRHINGDVSSLKKQNILDKESYDELSKYIYELTKTVESDLKLLSFKIYMGSFVVAAIAVALIETVVPKLLK